MAAKPKANVRFLPTSTGKVHVVTTKANDLKTSGCVTVKRGWTEGKWGRKRGVSAEAAQHMDKCSKCDVAKWAQLAINDNMTAAQKRAAAKAKADETRERLADRKQGRKPKPKARAAAPGRRGPRGSDPARGKEQAQEHLEYAKKHGWSVKLVEEDGEFIVIAKQDRQTARLVYRGGKVVFSRVAFTNGREVKLRNSANWRKQISLPVNKRPGQENVQARGNSKKSVRRAAERNEAARGEDGQNVLPFDPVEDDASTIIEALAGNTIVWRNGLTTKLDTAKVPIKSRNSRVTSHPATGRRIINFHEVMGESERGEVLGGERSVYLDKIIEVNKVSGRYEIHHHDPESGSNKTACGRDAFVGVVRSGWDSVTCNKCLKHNNQEG